MPCPAGDFRSIDHPPQGPGIGGHVVAQLVGARREAPARRRLNAPVLKLRLCGYPPGGRPPGGRIGLPPPLAVDRPVLQDRAHCVEPPPPHEPGRPAILTRLDLYRLPVHPAHAPPRLPPSTWGKT